MPMKKSAIILLSLFVVSMTGGCKILKSLVRSPSIQLDTVVLKGTSLFQGDLEFTFNITNPNPIGITVDSMTYQLSIDGKKTMEGSSTQGIALFAMATKSITVPLTVNYMESVDSLLDFFKKDSITYEVAGTFKIGAFTVPFSHKDVIALPKPPTVQVKGVSIEA
jgi:LEA14-like dessication related protein